MRRRYLSAAIEDPNPDVFLRAMANVAPARVLDSLGVKLNVAA